LHILDIAMNSITANASRVEINVLESQKRDRLVLRVRDDGHGMSPAILKRVLTSHWSGKSQRKKPIGLGLALLRQTSEMCGGRFCVRSAPRRGTSVTASMQLSHVDRPPLGDMDSTILALCAAGPNVDIRLNYRSDEQEFQFSSQELTPKGKVRV